MVPTTHIFPKNTYFDHLYLHSWVTSGNIRPEMTDMLIAELEKVLKTIAQEYPEQDELPPIITINTKGQKTHRCYFARYLDLRDKHCKNETDPFWISKDSTLLTAFAKAAAPNTRLKRSLSANQDPEKPAESNDEQYAVMDNLGDAGPFFLSHYSDTIDYLDKKPDLNKHALLIVKAMLKSTETRYPLPYSQPFANLCSTYCQKLITEYSAPEHESRADSTVFLLLIYLMQFHDANRYFEVSEPTSDIDLAPMSFHDPNDPPYFKFCGSDGSENEKALSLLERLIDGQLLKDEPLEDVNEFCWGLFVQVAETFFTGMDDVSMLSRCASDAENDEDFMDYLGEDAPGLAEQKDEAIKIYHLYNKISNAASFNEAPSPGEKKIKL